MRLVRISDTVNCAAMTPKERADAGKGAKMIGRWHDTAGRQGMPILEAGDLIALQKYLNRWNSHMDMDVVPVLDEEEAALLAKAVVAEQTDLRRRALSAV